MVGTHIVSRTLAICALVLGLAAVASPALAQTGQIRGKVVDADNKPVEGAKVTLQAVETNSKFELKTKKNGEYMQIGIPPGNYKITAEKDGLSATKNSHIGLDMAEVNLTLAKGGAALGEMSKEDRAKAEARVAGIKTAFSEGAALANAGKFDEAIAKFNEVLKEVPKCPECYIGIGHSSAAKKDYPAAETAYKKAIELDPNSIDAVQRPRDDLQRPEEIRRGEGDERRGNEARGSGRCGRRRRRFALQRGSDFLERERLRESTGAVRRGPGGKPESRGIAFHARAGVLQPR